MQILLQFVLALAQYSLFLELEVIIGL